MLKTLAVLTLLVMLPVAPLSAADRYSVQGKVIGIDDGDSLTVLLGKQPLEVRLYGIDSPERGQAHCSKAKELTSQLALQRIVSLQVIDTDRYGRKVSKITLPDGRILNHELVKAGLAWWYREYAPEDTAIRDLEEAARTSKVGLWSERNPIPPWEWRREKRSFLARLFVGIAAKMGGREKR